VNGHRALDWLRERSYHHTEFPVERLLAERTGTVSVCLPAREEAGTIKGIVETLAELRGRGLLDQVVVIDANSADGTAALAAAAGAEVHQQASLLPEFGPVLGKGDAMWRSLSVLTGDVVCFLDADSGEFGPHFPCGMIGPLVCVPDVQFAKGAFRRPFKVGDVEMPDGGGRVTELTARPLLNLFYPELAGFRQPLAGEFAARRELIERMPFATGYAVEIAMLIDAYRMVGPWSLAQVDIDVRQNRHQPLTELGPMAYAVLRAVAERLEREGRLGHAEAGDFLLPVDGTLMPRAIEIVERPPMASLRSPAPAG
jgi:glucosyl-3-phosphoglycerate synthase